MIFNIDNKQIDLECLESKRYLNVRVRIINIQEDNILSTDNNNWISISLHSL